MYIDIFSAPTGAGKTRAPTLARCAKNRQAKIAGILKSLRRYGTLGGSGR